MSIVANALAYASPHGGQLTAGGRRQARRRGKAPSIAALVALALAFMAVDARAGEIVPGELVYGGTGCAEGSASIVLQSKMPWAPRPYARLTFAGYVVDLRGGGGLEGRRACNLALAVDVPDGITVAAPRVDYQLGVNLPAGAELQFQTESFLAGRRGASLARVTAGPFVGKQSATSGADSAATVWSACGADVILRAASSIKVSQGTIGPGEGSVRVEAANLYWPIWKRC